MRSADLLKVTNNQNIWNGQKIDILNIFMEFFCFNEANNASREIYEHPFEKTSF